MNYFSFLLSCKLTGKARKNDLLRFAIFHGLTAVINHFLVEDVAKHGICVNVYESFCKQNEMQMKLFLRLFYFSATVSHFYGNPEIFK